MKKELGRACGAYAFLLLLLLSSCSSSPKEGVTNVSNLGRLPCLGGISFDNVFGDGAARATMAKEVVQYTMSSGLSALSFGDPGLNLTVVFIYPLLNPKDGKTDGKAVRVTFPDAHAEAWLVYHSAGTNMEDELKTLLSGDKGEKIAFGAVELKGEIVMTFAGGTLARASVLAITRNPIPANKTAILQQIEAVKRELAGKSATKRFGSESEAREFLRCLEEKLKEPAPARIAGQIIVLPPQPKPTKNPPLRLPL